MSMHQPSRANENFDGQLFQSKHFLCCTQANTVKSKSYYLPSICVKQWRLIRMMEKIWQKGFLVFYSPFFFRSYLLAPYVSVLTTQLLPTFTGTLRKLLANIYKRFTLGLTSMLFSRKVCKRNCWQSNCFVLVKIGLQEMFSCRILVLRHMRESKKVSDTEIMHLQFNI